MRRTGKKTGWRIGILCGMTMAAGSLQAMPDETPTGRAIQEVLRAHDQELLKLPGVVGVYVGLLADGKTSCLKVMLRQKTPATERVLPKTLGGYPVVMEVTGEVRPQR